MSYNKNHRHILETSKALSPRCLKTYPSAKRLCIHKWELYGDVFSPAVGLCHNYFLYSNSKSLRDHQRLTFLTQSIMNGKDISAQLHGLENSPIQQPWMTKHDKIASFSSSSSRVLSAGSMVAQIDRIEPVKTCELLFVALARLKNCTGIFINRAGPRTQ